MGSNPRWRLLGIIQFVDIILLGGIIYLGGIILLGCAEASLADEYAARLKACCGDLSATLDVDGLCRAVHHRLLALVAAKGDRLPHRPPYHN